MRVKRRFGAVFAIVATAALVASGCSGGDSDDSDSGNDLYSQPVTLDWWHNANTEGPLRTYWQKVADDFTKLHPTVTINVTPIETNELQRNRLPAALLSGDAPEIFQAWGGGEMSEQVKSDYLMDITEAAKAEVASIGPAAKIWSVEGKQYGLPFSFGIEGFWYNKDMFAQAGITSPPKTLDELNDAVSKLKAAGKTPIALGAGDKWPAAHWWYNFAVRECSAETLANAGSKQEFKDACFVKAGERTKAFIDTNPFQANFLATPGQQGATSSAGLLANGNAGMELMGHWNGGTMSTLTPDQKQPAFLDWFPFPSVPGAGGSQDTQMGGGDGFSCSKKAPKECVEFLKYILSADVQKGFAGTGSGIPTVKGAESGLTDPVLQTIAKATQSAGGVQLWLDTTFGAKAGTAMNDAIVAIFANQGNPQGVVEALQKATAR